LTFNVNSKNKKIFYFLPLLPFSLYYQKMSMAKYQKMDICITIYFILPDTPILPIFNLNINGEISVFNYFLKYFRIQIFSSHTALLSR